jgi:general secretion pathway protein G
MIATFLESKRRHEHGFTLFEMVVTLTVLAVLVMGTLPLAQNAVKREREIRLRETLRQIRNAIDEFKRDTNGACAAGTTDNKIGPVPQAAPDPRSRVIISDCEIFEAENFDRFPPTLETLVDGVKVRQRGVNLRGGGAFDTKNATEINSNEETVKVYLRAMPVDPMTGESNWKLRSSYQEKDDDSWDEVNVFDVRSASEEEGLNGVKYSEW